MEGDRGANQANQVIKNIEMKNEREQIIQRLKEYTQVSGSHSLVDLLIDTMDDRSKACTRLQVKLK